ncbi:MAG: thiamine phosphate synthase [Myxococcales bacterium]|nr:thiamine phosphate synthase [Myxococcales bacterium]
MRRAGAIPEVVQITDAGLVDEATLFARIERAAPLAERFLVMLRDPGLPSYELLRFGLRLRERLTLTRARLIVNDRLDLAHALGADGVHLGRRSVSPNHARRLLGPELFVTHSAHDLEEALAAAASGADAILLSPIFASPGKGPPLGLDTLALVFARVPVNVSIIALGGVTASNARACIAAGAAGVASIRADLSRLHA